MEMLPAHISPKITLTWRLAIVERQLGRGVFMKEGQSSETSEILIVSKPIGSVSTKPEVLKSMLKLSAGDVEIVRNLSGGTRPVCEDLPFFSGQSTGAVRTDKVADPLTDEEAEKFLEANCFEIDREKAIVGLFPVASLLNASCCPTAAWSTTGNGDKTTVVVYAIKELTAGAEITIGCCSIHVPVKLRKVLLRSILCKCVRCVREEQLYKEDADFAFMSDTIGVPGAPCNTVSIESAGVAIQALETKHSDLDLDYIRSSLLHVYLWLAKELKAVKALKESKLLKSAVISASRVCNNGEVEYVVSQAKKAGLLKNFQLENKRLTLLLG